jgi:hypothetical protein
MIDSEYKRKTNSLQPGAVTLYDSSIFCVSKASIFRLIPRLPISNACCLTDDFWFISFLQEEMTRKMKAEKARKSAASTEKWLKAQGEASSKKRSLGAAGTPDGKKVKREQGQPFQRIDSEKELAGIEHQELLDNSYEGTFGADGWGAKVGDLHCICV